MISYYGQWDVQNQSYKLKELVGAFWLLDSITNANHILNTKVCTSYRSYVLNVPCLENIQSCIAKCVVGEILKMSHYSKGVDPQGRLLLDIIVRGYVPEIPTDQTVRLQPYWEQYTQTGPGVYIKIHQDIKDYQIIMLALMSLLPY